MAEHPAVNRRVAGSSPARGATPVSTNKINRLRPHISVNHLRPILSASCVGWAALDDVRNWVVARCASAPRVVYSARVWPPRCARNPCQRYLAGPRGRSPWGELACRQQRVDVSGRRRRLAGKRLHRFFWDSPRETLAKLLITGHLRCFSNQPVAEIVQWASQACSIDRISQLEHSIWLRQSMYVSHRVLPRGRGRAGRCSELPRRMTC
jgi:hypothetical protein